MGTGVLCYFALRSEPPLWLGIAVAIPAVGGVLLLRRHARVACRRHGLAAAAIGFTAAQFATARALPQPVLPTACDDPDRHRPLCGGAPRGSTHRDWKRCDWTAATRCSAGFGSG